MKRIHISLKKICKRIEDRRQFYITKQNIEKNFPELTANQVIILSVRYGITQNEKSGKIKAISINNIATICRVKKHIVESTIKIFNTYNDRYLPNYLKQESIPKISDNPIDNNPIE